MEFNSIDYIIFLASVFILYQFVNQKARLALLLCASYYFYACWNVKYTFLIIGITLLSYFAAIFIGRYSEYKKKILVLGILVICSLLFIFKYYNFFAEIVNYLLNIEKNELRISNLNILLPVGISFYSFQAISYIADVYRGNGKAEKSLLKYSLYIAFFPQLVAGPIERAQNIIPQFKKEYQFDYGQAAEGLLLITWGLFKKMVIADELAIYVNNVYGNVNAYTGFSFVIATLMFAIQIYCDFSGYSDIAVGSAKLFGISLMKNFRSPYLAASLKEFWNRWHISLSQWMRDYVYIPLGGSRKGIFRADINLFITFLVSGLWHGADMTYILWGGVFGLAGVLEKHVGVKGSGYISKITGWIITFFICCFTWIFFRSNNLGDAKYIILHSLENITLFKQYIVNGYMAMGLDLYKSIQIIASVIILAIADILQNKYGEAIRIRRLPLPVRWAVYLMLVLCILLFSNKGGVEFVYFQF